MNGSSNFAIKVGHPLISVKAAFSVVLLFLFIISTVDVSQAGSKRRAVIAAGVAGVLIGVAIANKNKKKKQQASKKSAPKKKVAKKKPSKKKRVAKRKKTSSSKKVAAVSQKPVSGNGEEVAAVQAKLNAIGFDAGPVDGKPGRKTREAVKNYQTSIGASATGILTQDQKDRLLGGGETVVASDGASTVDTAPPVINASVQQDDEAVASIQPVPVTPIDPVEVQNALNQLGFDAGPANGKLEGKSVVAIMAFQDTLGQPQTGTLTDGQTKKLLNAASVAPVPSDDSLENVETEIASTSVLPSSTDTGNSEAVIAEDLGDLDTLE